MLHGGNGTNYLETKLFVQLEINDNDNDPILVYGFYRDDGSFYIKSIKINNGSEFYDIVLSRLVLE